jgi:DNA-binding NtrC family response regulator
MDASLGALNLADRITPLGDPSVLIVDQHPGLLESLPLTLTSALPEVSFDFSSSRDEGLSKLDAGRYHAVISDARMAEATGYQLLKHTQALACPVPFLVTERSGDGQAVAGALSLGAFDLIGHSLRAAEIAVVVKRALWFYQLRLTIHGRRQRLDRLRRQHVPSVLRSVDHGKHLIERTIKNIEETDLLCQRTIQ